MDDETIQTFAGVWDAIADTQAEAADLNKRHQLSSHRSPGWISHQGALALAGGGG